MRKLHVFVGLITTFTAGCSLKPIPDDATGLSTVAIVSRVRCEIKEGIYALIEEQLIELGDNESLKRLTLIKKDPKNIIILKDYRKLPRTQARLDDRFDDTIIVLDFQLRITENNNFGAGATLVRPLTTSLELIGFSAANNKERQNFRTFRITTNLKEIFTDACPAGGAGGVNWEYPIAGNIGLKETFKTYFKLADVNKLDKLKDFEGESPFVDTIRFTTTVSAGIDPSLAVISQGQGYFFRDTSGSIGASRKDEHQLAVGIKLPPAQRSLARGINTRIDVNNEVDRSITKLQLFGVNPLNPLGPFNGP